MLLAPLAANHHTDHSDGHLPAYFEPRTCQGALCSRAPPAADGCWLEPIL